jgi:dihydropyrimidinase
MFDTVIRGGTIVSGEGPPIAADLGISGGQVAAIAPGLPAGTREIDARGHLVLPGGVDSHAHIDQPSRGKAQSPDTFDSASASAAVGGTTSVVCFSAQPRGGSLAEAHVDYARKAKASRIDYAFHLIVSDPTPELLGKELPALIAGGDRSVKIFLTYDGIRLTDDQALEVMAVAKRNQALVCIHAEHHDLITFLTRALVKQGLTAPKYHALAKPMIVERECVFRVIAMAEALDVPTQIFHVSGFEAAEEIRRARARGVKIFAETCSHYLVLTADDLDRPGFEGAKYICSPALRTEADQAALWDALRDGTLDNVSSDHAPSKYASPEGKMAEGETTPFTKVPNGLTGLAARLPVLFSEGVSKGRISVQQFVALASTNAAKLFGLYPRKGVLAVGSDADIAIWDATRKVTLTNALMAHGSDYTPFEGMEVTGFPVLTMVRGQVVAEGMKPVGGPGTGMHLARAPYEYIKPRGVWPAGFDPVA